MASAIDHVAHGWALLAIRLPELRPLATERRRVAELCECYSIAVLHLRTLAPDSKYIGEYEDMISGIELEVSAYLEQFAGISARRGLPSDP